MKIAVEGCAHGELEKIYECIETIQAKENFKIDLLLCCGDFQAVRNRSDLCAMAVTKKNHNMCTFYKYYSGEKKAPILTLFIGGNHEASNYLQELPYGGWVAPNIYYLGRAGVINFGDLRIGGISGIFNGQDYIHGLWECVPYTQRSIHSVYHIRSLDVFRLSQLKDKVHIMLSHDWPRGITDYGDKDALLQRKPFLRKDIEANRLGSPPAFTLLHTMQPDYWFSAHLHCQFVAIVEHEGGQETKFVALDKCLPKRRHLQIVDIPSEFDGDKTLKHDVEWLAVLKSTNYLLSVKNMDCHMPGPGGDGRYDFTPTENEKKEIYNKMKDITIKESNFVKTAPDFNKRDPKIAPSNPILNPQTLNLCDVLGIDDPIQVVTARTGHTMKKYEVDLPVVDITEEKTPPFTSTPKTHISQCSRLSLPSPITPNIEMQSESIISVPDSPGNIEVQSESIISVPDSPVTESLNTMEPSTPITKKTCKRLNMAIYNTTDEDEVSVSTVLDSEESL